MQTQPVEIIRKVVEETHDKYLNGRQADKAILELATRAQDPVVRDLLVETVNMAQVELAKLKETPVRSECWT